MHLTSNVGYLLSFVLALLLLPLVIIHAPFAGSPLRYIELGVFIFSMSSVGVFYGLCLKEMNKNWISRLKDIPALLALGIGMGLANSKSVFEGLIGHQTHFIRTPKYGIRGAGTQKHNRSYSLPQFGFTLAQSLFAFYSLVTLVIALWQGNWPVVPFVCLFLFGFTYIATHAFRDSRE